jgi:hypothetical protein
MSFNRSGIKSGKSKQLQWGLFDKNDPNTIIKKWIWIYLLLLIFEGALRKWILPGLAGPILIIRDPVAIVLIFLASSKGVMPKSGYITWMIVFAVFGVFTALTIGHGNLAVALYGARIAILHFPVIFIIGAVFNKEDVITVGKFLVYLSIPMAFLTAAQFYSPQSAFVNRGVGGDEGGAGFTGALGFYRPPGTFSFTNGNTLFFGLVAPYIFYFWLYPSGLKRIILLAATGCLVLAIPLSISRALFLSVVVSGAFTVFGVSRNPRYISKIVMAIVGIVVLFLILGQTSYFSQATEAFTARFEGANESEGGLESVLLDRYLGGMIGELASSSEMPFFGHGIGIATNLGGQIFGPTPTEGEWGRIIYEQGVIMGLGIVFIRLAFSVGLFKDSYQRLKSGDLLPWILLGFFLLNVPQAQWKQPTSLGFSIVVGGLQIASLRRLKPKPKPVIKSQSISGPVNI